MDVSSVLASGMEDLKKMLESHITGVDDKLGKVAASVPNNPDIVALTREFSEFKLFVWKALGMLKSQIELLSLGLDRHETLMRRKVLLFHGLPEDKDEKPCDVIHKVLTDKMKLSELSTSDIKASHRLGSNESKARPILVRFLDFEHRQLVWETKTSLKGSGFTISEFLTKSRHKVFMAARSHFGVNRCWTSEGKITIILPDKSRRKVETMSELQSLIAKHPQAATPPPPPRGSGAARPPAVAKQPAQGQEPPQEQSGDDSSGHSAKEKSAANAKRVRSQRKNK